MGNYTLDQAQRDIADLRGQIAHGLAFSEFLSATVAGTFTAPDGTVWTNTGGMVRDSWHSVVLDSGWGGGGNGIFYRLTAWHTVQVFGSIVRTTGTITAGTNINNSNLLPAAYRPTKTWNIGGTGIPTRAGAEVTAAGLLVAEPNGAACPECDIAGEYPIIDI